MTRTFAVLRKNYATSILGHYAFVLFDSGCIYSFISATFVGQARLELEPLSFNLLVSTPIRLAREKGKTCQVLVSNRRLDVTLIMLEMKDFDVILGMD